MAVLSDPNRESVWADFMRTLTPNGETSPLMTKADLRAAVNAADDWADTNASSFNTALPTAFKNNATAKQKARLLVWVVEKRWYIQ